MITIKNLSKEFKIFKRRIAPLRMILGIARADVDYDVVKSLNDISIHVKKGTAHGIVGMNGAGKSTLLKILAGVLSPTNGTVEVQGRVAALLELGTGFHGDLTGRNNIYLNGAIMGLSHSDIDQRIEEIQKFAELGDFFDRPVKIYSSGMYVRLAFAFAVSVDPDVLIIDEALAVGDAYFQQKCLKKIQEFKAKGVTILLVSHDFSAIKLLCDQATVLSKGKVHMTGTPMQALDTYNALLAAHQSEGHVSQSQSHQESFASGSGDMTIESVELLCNDLPVEALVSGQQTQLKISAKTHKGPIESPTCGILIRDRLGYDVFGTNTFHLRQASGILQSGDQVEFVFDFAMNLGPGEYTITVALHDHATHASGNYHWIDRALIFKVLPSSDFSFIGVTRLEPSCQIRKRGF
jgi:lipopolysaccharide transport system ATP-binding protein